MALSEAQREWLILAGPDGLLPRTWPKGRAGNAYERKVDNRIWNACEAAGLVGWCSCGEPCITDKGRRALEEG